MSTEKKNGKKRVEPEPNTDLHFVGEPVPRDIALRRWPFRYRSRKARIETLNNGDDEKDLVEAKHHFLKAKVDDVEFSLGDDVYVTAEPGMPNHLAKIVEFFEAIHGEPYFRARWFYRASDTVIKDLSSHVHPKRVFLSNVHDDNPLSCIYSAVHIVKIPLKIVTGLEESMIPACDFYYDMKYELEHLTFSSADDDCETSSSSSTISNESHTEIPRKNEKFLLDLYSGCGGMSTGLCAGALISGVKLITKWAVDINSSACESLKLNHPETEVRNEPTDEFLKLLIEWRKLCQSFSLIPGGEPIDGDTDSEEDEKNDDADAEFEVEEFLEICYGDPKEIKKPGLHLKVHWKGYGPEEDTWEPYEGIKGCKDRLKEFVTKGFNSNLLPLPGTVHFVCGGPPCQGISGFNRFRNPNAPLEDEKNGQLLVYMDIINYLKPHYVLMENVVDLLKFSKGFMARCAVTCLVSMNYQTRLGMMMAGSYGVPQTRCRVFMWGAHPTMKLPPYPLPTHEVLYQSSKSKEFEAILVGHNQKNLKLEKALTLRDALTDLPPATNTEVNDVRNYETEPQCAFQKYISLARAESIIPKDGGGPSEPRRLFDHQPLEQKADDLERTCQIPKKKGANFRDLKGVLVKNNVAYLDPSIERPRLKSGKYLVPNYAIKFTKGTSKKPFGRKWFDEVVRTVVTRAEPHNQAVLHPLQDRVLSVRENARLQGFPDFYKLCGTIKEKYIQVGNAVAVPVGVALGYAFGMASRGLTDDQPVITLPFKYPECMEGSVEEDVDEEMQ
ncbi:chromomethylase [Arabis alpina]|uniref:DNA (cytosine-5-)-methyltransferase n=1 Tax=Arabis alpina TaxID=50452 RepID=A0A087GEM9_ARAAL|nr:chromomethylase [Arabis alpina]